MKDKIENIDTIFLHWKESAEENYSTMQNLLKTSEYSWALFIGHLVIEKLLKALYVKKIQQHAAYSHDLLRLAKNAGIDIPEEYSEWLDEITTFNINARYENYKQSFSKLCTKDFTERWANKIEILRKWLINQL